MHRSTCYHRGSCNHHQKQVVDDLDLVDQCTAIDLKVHKFETGCLETKTRGRHSAEIVAEL